MAAAAAAALVETVGVAISGFADQVIDSCRPLGIRVKKFVIRADIPGKAQPQGGAPRIFKLDFDRG
mgnify:CR=1 FL=1